MCAVEGGRALGSVERVVLDENAARLFGLIVRRGIGGAKWFPRRRVKLLGHSCVLVEGDGERPPKELPEQPGRVTDTSGLTLGTVTDALICEKSMSVAALEVSFGTLYRLMGQSAYALEYQIRREEGGVTVVVKRLTGLDELPLGRERGMQEQ